MTFDRVSITQDGAGLAMGVAYLASGLFVAAASAVARLRVYSWHNSDKVTNKTAAPVRSGFAAVDGEIAADQDPVPVVSVRISLTGKLGVEDKTNVWHYEEESREVNARPFVLLRSGTRERIRVMADKNVRLGALLLLDGGERTGNTARRWRRAVLEPGHHVVVSGVLSREIDDERYTYRDAETTCTLRAPDGARLTILAESATSEVESLRDRVRGL